MGNYERVLITGGAQGIGRQLAGCFLREGAEVIITDVNKAQLSQTQTELEAIGRVHSYPMDITDRRAVASARERINDEVGAINVLVNNAGVVFGGPFLDTALDRHRTTFEVNLLGMVSVTHAFLPDLIAQRQAYLVNLASASGLVGLPFGSTYAASKWGAIGFSESLRRELSLEHKNVAVVTVCPSYVNTGMFAGAAPPRTTRMLDPVELSQTIMAAVHKKQPFVYEPWVVKVTPLMKAVLPVFLSDLLSDVLGATASMRHWRGHAHAGEGEAESVPASGIPVVDAVFERLRGIGLPW